MRNMLNSDTSISDDDISNPLQTGDAFSHRQVLSAHDPAKFRKRSHAHMYGVAAIHDVR